jgi:hypothetical protein
MFRPDHRRPSSRSDCPDRQERRGLCHGANALSRRPGNRLRLNHRLRGRRPGRALPAQSGRRADPCKARPGLAPTRARAATCGPSSKSPRRMCSRCGSQNRRSSPDYLTNEEPKMTRHVARHREFRKISTSLHSLCCKSIRCLRCQPFAELGPAPAPRHVMNRVGNGLLLPDQNDQLFAAGDAGVKQISLDHDRDDYGRIFRAWLL